MQRTKKFLRNVLSSVVLGMVLGGVFVLFPDMPVVQYSAATRKPVGCLVEPDTNGVNWLPASNARCERIIAGRHDVEWVR